MLLTVASPDCEYMVKQQHCRYMYVCQKNERGMHRKLCENEVPAEDIEALRRCLKEHDMSAPENPHAIADFISTYFQHPVVSFSGDASVDTSTGSVLSIPSAAFSTSMRSITPQNAGGKELVKMRPIEVMKKLLKEVRFYRSERQKLVSTSSNKHPATPRRPRTANILDVDPERFPERNDPKHPLNKLVRLHTPRSG